MSEKHPYFFKNQAYLKENENCEKYVQNEHENKKNIKGFET